MLLNPMHVPKKGWPTERSKRRKTLLKQREDAHKNKAKKEEKKKPRGKPGPKKKTDVCSYCNEDDHSVKTCEYLKAAMGIKKCPYCNEEGHAIQECIYLKVALKRDADIARATELRL